MFNLLNAPKPIMTIPTFSNLQGLTSFIDSLAAEKEYTFKIAGTNAGNVGVLSQYGFITAKIYSSEAATLEYISLLATADTFRLRKYQGVWDGGWTRIKTTVVT